MALVHRPIGLPLHNLVQGTKTLLSQRGTHGEPHLSDNAKASLSSELFYHRSYPLNVNGTSMLLLAQGLRACHLYVMVMDCVFHSHFQS